MSNARSSSKLAAARACLLASALAVFVLAIAFSTSASAATLSSASFNLKGHSQYIDINAIPWTTMSCYSSLTANSGTVQSHRAGISKGGGPTVAYSPWTTATVAYSPWVTCYNQNTWSYGEQSTSASIVRNYTLRVYGQ